MSPRSTPRHVRRGPGLGHRGRVTGREGSIQRLGEVRILISLLRLGLGFPGHENFSGSPFHYQREIAVGGQNYPTVLAGTGTFGTLLRSVSLSLAALTL
jgi:hypothetical protein